MEKDISNKWQKKKKQRELYLYRANQTLNIVKRDKEVCYIMIKESIHQEDITTTNIYAPNIRAHNYIKLKQELKAEINSNTKMAGDFITPF